MNDASDQDINRSLIRNRYRKAAYERYGGGFGELWKKRWRIVCGGGSSDALRSNTRIRRRQTRKRKR
jgi:hypothetical protein